MLSLNALSIYYWGAYVWLILGFVVIGGPAIVELYKIFTTTNKTNSYKSMEDN